MALQRIKLSLTELRCLAQSEGGSGSEPYLWTTFFAFGGQRLPSQTGNLGIITPAYDAFRTEFPDGMTAGQVAAVPPFIASAHFDIDLDTAPRPKLVGCVVILMEEDSTPHNSIVMGRIAYAKEIEAQLEALVHERIRTQNFDDITQAEYASIQSAVSSKVRSAIARNQWNPWRDQDDNIGATYALFRYPKPADVGGQPSGRWIELQYFDLPEITNSKGDRFVLSGRLSVEAIPPPTIVICATERAALEAKQDQLDGLRRRIATLQQQLANASAPQKAAIVDELEATNRLIAEAEAQIPALRAALNACMPHDAGGLPRRGPGSI